MPWELNGKGNMLAASIEGEKQGSSNHENGGMCFLPRLIGCCFVLVFFFSLFLLALLCVCVLFVLLLRPNLDSCIKSNACRSLSVRSPHCSGE